MCCGSCKFSGKSASPKKEGRPCKKPKNNGDEIPSAGDARARLGPAPWRRWRADLRCCSSVR